MNPLKVATDYLQGVQAEMRKVVWPTLPTLGQHLISVVLGMAVFGAFVGGVDYVFIHVLAFLIKK